MRGKAMNIMDILARYFEGSASDRERMIAEDYLMHHPGIMDQFAAENSLVLVPEGETGFDIARLLKAEKEYDDYQFQMLAAAAAEGDLSGEQLADFNDILVSGPERSVIAGEISRMRLKPGKEKWKGKSKALRTPVFGFSAERAFVVLLSAAATFALVVLLKPALTDDLSTQALTTSLAAEMRTQVTPDDNTLLISASVPATKRTVVEAAAVEAVFHSATGMITTMAQPAAIREDMIVKSTAEAATMRIDPEDPGYLARVKPNTAVSAKPQKIFDNWMITGITNVAFSLAEERRIKDPVDFAGKRIDEINRLLGWEMQLKKEMDKNGDLKAVTFQSGLLCFSTPVKNK